MVESWHHCYSEYNMLSFKNFTRSHNLLFEFFDFRTGGQIYTIHCAGSLF